MLYDEIKLNEGDIAKISSEGIATKTAQERLGHSDFSTTMNTYSHVLDSVAKDAANTIEDVLFTKFGG